MVRYIEEGVAKPYWAQLNNIHLHKIHDNYTYIYLYNMNPIQLRKLYIK